MLEPIGEAWTLVDDGLSRDGSFVNGSRVQGRHRLQDRDRTCLAPGDRKSYPHASQ